PDQRHLAPVPPRRGSRSRATSWLPRPTGPRATAHTVPQPPASVSALARRRAAASRQGHPPPIERDIPSQAPAPHQFPAALSAPRLPATPPRLSRPSPGRFDGPPPSPKPTGVPPPAALMPRGRLAEFVPAQRWSALGRGAAVHYGDRAAPARPRPRLGPSGPGRGPFGRGTRAGRAARCPAPAHGSTRVRAPDTYPPA